MAAAHITDDKFEAEVLQSKLPVMVDFYAEWCGPCKMAAPVLEELSETYKGKIKIVKVDVDQSQLSSTYGVLSIPTVVVFKGAEGKDAKEMDRKVGFPGKAGYIDMIEKAIAA